MAGWLLAKRRRTSRRRGAVHVVARSEDAGRQGNRRGIGLLDLRPEVRGRGAPRGQKRPDGGVRGWSLTDGRRRLDVHGIARRRGGSTESPTAPIVRL